MDMSDTAKNLLTKHKRSRKHISNPYGFAGEHGHLSRPGGRREDFDQQLSSFVEHQRVALPFAESRRRQLDLQLSKIISLPTPVCRQANLRGHVIA